MPDVRAVQETIQFQAGSPATIQVAAVDTEGAPVDVTGLSFVVALNPTGTITATTSDPETGTRVFTLTGEDTTEIAAKGGLYSIADGDAEWIVGTARASTEGTKAQDHTLAVTAGAAQISVEVAAFIGAGGGGGTGVWTLTRDAGLTLDATQSTAATRAEVLTEWGFTHYPDGDAGGFLVGATGTLRHYNVSEGYNFNVAVTTVDGSDLFAAPRHEAVIADVPTGLDFCSGGPIVDIGGGEGLMVLHVEENPVGGEVGAPWIYWTFHCAKVVDTGSGAPTITYLGPLIQHQLTKANATSGEVRAYVNAGHLIVSDGYAYVYHLDFMADESSHGAVSRCSIDDIETALAADEAPVFHKWNGESLAATWTELALGGASTDVGQPGTKGDVLGLPDGRILWVSQTDDNNTAWWMESAVATDPITWGDVTAVTPAQSDREWTYLTLWSGDPESPKVVTGPTAVAYFLSAHTTDRWSDYTIERAVLSPVAAFDLSDYQLAAGLYAPLGDYDLDGRNPGVVNASVKNSTVTMPVVATAKGGVWEVWNTTDADPGNIIIAANAADPDINFVSDLTVPPGDVAILWIASGFLWVGRIFPTASGSTMAAILSRLTDLEAAP